MSKMGQGRSERMTANMKIKKTIKLQTKTKKNQEAHQPSTMVLDGHINCSELCMFPQRLCAITCIRG